MRLFIYKLLISLLAIFILFQITVGYLVRSYENKLFNLFSKDKVSFIVNTKIREEIKNSLNKDRILSKEDSLLIKNFLNKISKELSE